LLPSSEKGFLRTVQVSLEAGIPVNHVNKLGWSALLEAVILGDGGYLYRDVIDALLDANADIHLQDRDGLSALDHARLMGQTGIVARMENLPVEDEVHNVALITVKHHIRRFEYEQALGVLSDGPERFADQVGYHYYCGYVLTELQRYQEAVEAYRLGLQLTDNPAEFYLYIANSYRLAKQVPEALAEFDKGIQANPQSGFVRYHKSNYLREIGYHEQAVQEMDALLAELPHRYDYSFHKANSLRSLGRHEQAICAIENAITHDVSNALYHIHKAQSLILLGRYKQAMMVIDYAEKVCDEISDLGKCRSEIVSLLAK
ncbi:CDC27 family protein, partial [Vibrio sp.]|uniref:CDC27 family protein n=1 Tax=Vibrio sp. TaxID=678 RepID=UPI003D0AB44F